MCIYTTFYLLQHLSTLFYFLRKSLTLEVRASGNKLNATSTILIQSLIRPKQQQRYPPLICKNEQQKFLDKKLYWLGVGCWNNSCKAFLILKEIISKLFGIAAFLCRGVWFSPKLSYHRNVSLIVYLPIVYFSFYQKTNFPLYNTIK